MIRRKPAACWNVRSPTRGTFSSCRRLRNGAVLVAERDDVLGERFVEAGDAREQRRRRGVDVGADGVDAVLDDRVELLRQLRLADVVLILADADRLRLDAHELGERILQPARDRHRAAQRHVEIGKLLRRELRRRVDRGAGLRDHDLRQRAAPAARSIRSPASLSVSRDAVPLPIAMSCTPWRAHERAPACAARPPSPCAARADRPSRCRAACRCRRRPRP